MASATSVGRRPRASPSGEANSCRPVGGCHSLSSWSASWRMVRVQALQQGRCARPRTRNIIASVLGVLAVLLLVVGTVAVWARVTVRAATCRRPRRRRLGRSRGAGGALRLPHRHGLHRRRRRRRCSTAVLPTSCSGSSRCSPAALGPPSSEGCAVLLGERRVPRRSPAARRAGPRRRDAAAPG